MCLCPLVVQAAFQLLEERDRLFSASMWWSLPEGGVGLSSDHVVNRGVEKRPLGNGRSKNLVKSGALRKATSNSLGRLETTRWKTKYVEVTPGRLAYADEGSSVLGKR